MVPRQTQDDFSGIALFFVVLAITFATTLLAMLPIAALALGLTMLIVAPLMLVVGAFVASLMSWGLGRMLGRGSRSGRFLRVLLGGEVAALGLLVALYILTMSHFPLAPWIVPVVVCAAIIAYRTTALAWWN